jgi:uncharacterized membrane protein YbhN (UPF0104 family)
VEKTGPLLRLKKHRLLLQLLGSLALLTFLLGRIDPRKLLDLLTEGKSIRLTPWLAGYFFLAHFITGNGLYSLFRRIRRDGYWRIVWIPWKLEVLSTVLPGRLGDVGLVYFLRDRFRPAQSLAVLIADKLVTLEVTLLLSTLGLWRFVGWRWAVVLPGAALLGLSALLALSRGRARRLLRGFLARFLGPHRAHLEEFRRELEVVLGDWWGLLANHALTLFRDLLAGVSFGFMLHSLSVEVSIFDVALVQAMARLASLLPITFMGLGTVEAVQMGCLAQAGVPPEAVLTISLVARTVQLSLLLGAYWIGFSPRWSRTVPAAEAAPPAP